MTSMLFFLAGSVCSQDPELATSIDKLIQYEHPGLSERIPGMIIAAWDENEQWIMVRGQIDTSHFFELGSVSKPVTATVTLAFMDLEKIDPSGSFCLLLPPDICHEAWSDCAVEDVLEHRAGLPRTGMLTGRDTLLSIDERLLHMMVQMSIPRAGRYAYSHTGYAALFWFLANEERQSDLNIFLDRYSCRTSLRHDEVLAPGFGVHLLPANPVPEDCMVWATGLKATCRGLLQFVRDESKAISHQRDVSEKMWLDEIDIAQRHEAYKVYRGWFLIKEKKKVICYHNGRTPGHSVSIAFEPFSNRGCVVMANGAAGTQSLSLDILRILRQARK